jgi:two-component system, NtrC family, sensor kinase
MHTCFGEDMEGAGDPQRTRWMSLPYPVPDPEMRTLRTFDLRTFELHDMLRCGLDIRQAARSASSLESAATAVVGYLFGAFRDPLSGDPQLALARFYQTVPYRELEPDLRGFAKAALGTAPRDEGVKCLTLLATAGVEEAWNDRHQSRGHRAIPLASARMVHRAPMIAQLIEQMGMDVEHLLQTDRTLVPDADGRTYNIFYVDHAAGSPYIPAQADFVVPFKIESVVGFGGILRGEMFAVVLFSRVPITPAVANRFRNIALEVKAVMHPIERVFG